MARMPFEGGNPKGGLRLKRWLIGLLIFLLVSLLAINSFTIGQFRIIPFSSTANQVNDIETKSQESTTTPPAQSGYVVNNKGCHIPDLSPFEPLVMRYIDKAKPIVCEHGVHLPLVSSNNSAIFINSEARNHYYNESESIDCCWRNFWRSDHKDNEITISKDCHFFKEATFVNEEFIRVECQRKNESIYRDYFAFVPRKLYVEEHCRERLRTLRSNSVLPTPSPERLSVLVVGMDSVSRLNFHRSMPRTLRLLRDMGAVEMLGYNKVADNTYPNLVPVLSGLSQIEFEKLCWTSHKKPFDRCPLLWKNFKAKGYRTIFAEDACYMTIFNYLKPGFRKQPTDYYLRPYCVAAESEIGNTHKLNANLCLGTRLNFDCLLHYTRKVAEEFADDPYFGLFWQASLTHDYIEYPQLGDDSYHDFFEYLLQNDLLRNTMLVFMSDHGMRWGSFRQTYQGHLEDSLPFVFLLLPYWWRTRHAIAWNELKRNTRSLTTPFDLHETLRDILEPSRLAIQGHTRKDPKAKIPRGISMFRPIPEHRTCTMAGIPEHWCMCHERHNISHDDPIVTKVVGYLITELNGMLALYPQCAQLHVFALIDAKVLSNNAVEKENEAKETKKAPWTDYTVIIETTPGNAVFEGSMRHRADNGSIGLVGPVSRLNAYGRQSACVDDFHMRLYCFCH
ncbi:PREDICTED: uncharacterized protein LOC105368525 isoform X2 [Ceratosolen solmsi marchali]|uniref:Uncharacterized protein LOC105368525 isoform X2 n=1 Tax=Ceratosolen solmsi marchali TaxID=326594 RepID=A0AAJ6YWV7_9HYME|nr:PREDICTED: uncharacterized protein LOC105368525 isoform X2 [Ceratosolen solmsi marchali]